MLRTNNGPTVLVVVIDAIGISTLKYLLKNYKGEPKFPFLYNLGLKNLLNETPTNNSFVLEQASADADSVIGHREMLGVIDPTAYELFPEGFSQEYISALEEKINRKTIFNKMSGGTDAIKLNYEEHEKTGNPIVYSSKCDPIIQIAMNEKVIKVSEQHKIAEEALRLALEKGVKINRAISRAYLRTEENITRTPNRHDAVLPLEQPTLLNVLNEKGVWTTAVSKINDLIGKGFNDVIKISNNKFLDPSLPLKFVHPQNKDTNPHSAQATINAIISAQQTYRPMGTFIFANFVDTDSLYGHTKDGSGAIKAIEEIDKFLKSLIHIMQKGDLIIITSDHGMEHREDYGYHNKEQLPLLLCPIGNNLNINISTTKTLATIGHIIAQLFNCEKEYITKCNLEKYFN